MLNNMRLPLSVAALVAIASPATACLRVHVDLSTEIFTNDVVTIQLFYEETQVCVKGANSEFFTDNEEWYSIECPLGEGDAAFKYKVAVTENGKRGWVECKSFYTF
jgi:hypothetical protein